MNPDLIPVIGKYTFLVIGIGLLSGAFFMYRNIHQFIEESVATTGRVVDYETDYKKGEKETYYPIVEFQTQAGETLQFRSDYGGSPAPFEKDEIVKVLYNPNTPQEAKINSFMSLWLGLAIVGPLGVIFFTVGLGSIFFKWGE